jgi:hypothetical protein
VLGRKNACAANLGHWENCTELCSDILRPLALTMEIVGNSQYGHAVCTAAKERACKEEQ